MRKRNNLYKRLRPLEAPINGAFRGLFYFDFKDRGHTLGQNLVRQWVLGLFRASLILYEICIKKYLKVLKKYILKENVLKK